MILVLFAALMARPQLSGQELFVRAGVFSDPELEVNVSDASVSTNGKWLAAYGVGRRSTSATSGEEEVIWTWDLTTKKLDRWSRRRESGKPLASNLIKIFPDNTATVLSTDTSDPYNHEWFITSSASPAPSKLELPSLLTQPDTLLHQLADGRLGVLQFPITLNNGLQELTYRYWAVSPDKLVTRPSTEVVAATIPQSRRPRAILHGRYLVEIQEERPAQVVDLQRGRAFDLPDLAENTMVVALAEDGTQLATLSRDKLLRYVDVSTGRPLAAPPPLLVVDRSLQNFRPSFGSLRSGGILALGGDRGFAIVDLKNARVIQRIAGEPAIASAPNQDWLIVNTSAGLELWKRVARP